MAELAEAIFGNWGVFAGICVAVAGMFKIYYDHLETKRNLTSYQHTTTTTIAALESAKAERHKEVERKFVEQREKTDLEIRLARTEAEKGLLEYKHENNKRLDEQSKLIQELLLDMKEVSVQSKNILQMLSEIKDNQKDNQRFREEFYKGQAQNK